MNKILFLVHTEYHLLLIVSFIKEHYAQLEKPEFTLFIAHDPAGNRFKLPFDFSVLPLKVIWSPISEKHYQPSLVFKKVIASLFEEEYAEYVSFLEHSPMNHLFLRMLSGRKTKICLAPEGTKPYITISKTALPSRIKHTFSVYRFLFSQGFPWWKFYLNYNIHGYLPQTDFLWLEHSAYCENVNNKKVVEIEIFTKEETTSIAQQMFSFEQSEHFESNKRVILYLNHWFVVQSIYEYEMQILNRVVAENPGIPIYIKLHPNTPQFQIEAFRTLPNVVLNTSTIPAELFVLSLEDSVILSFWSASLLINKPSCRFYWMHKLLKSSVDSMAWWNIVNPTDHIKEISELEQLNFQL